MICGGSNVPEAWFPLQFSCTLEITSHLLPIDNEYPPKKRRMSIYYDYVNKRARADIDAGYEAAKFYIRRYDTKNEYMVRLPPIDDCKRSYLGEVMPFPEIPEDSVFKGVRNMNGVDCNYFVFTEFDVKVHIYLSLEGAPVMLFQEREDANNGQSIPLLTYEFSDVILEQPEESWFELPSPFEHKSCVRHIGGWPYLHVFHYFVRF
ncbi:hypothetical protein EON65_06290 [archaeon]|nr:MAG: hypothetical protein EON65_06290 [archaeon]